jgi:competence protein ComEC
MSKGSLVVPAVAMISGIWALEALGPWWAFLLPPAVAVCALCAIPGTGRRRAALPAAGVALCMLYVGGLEAWFRFPAPEPGDLYYACPEDGGLIPADIEGYCLERPRRYGETLLFLFQAERAVIRGTPRSRGGKVRLSLRSPASDDYVAEDEIAYGDRMRLSARLRRPRDYGNPGHRPYTENLAEGGVYCVGSIKSRYLMEKKEGRGGSLILSCFDRLRHGGQTRIRRYFAGGNGKTQQAGAFLEALLLGAREGLDRDLCWSLKKTGVYHILAVSGLNVGILLAGMLFGFRMLGVRDKRVNVFLIPVILSYAGIAGFSPPVTRASIMACMYLLGRCLEREVSLWNTLAASAILILLFRPYQIFNAGFQLSFAATAALTGLGPRLKEVMPSIPSFLSSSLAASLAAQAGVLPIMARDFFLICPVAIVMNLAAVTAVAVLIYGGVVFFCLSFVSAFLASGSAAVLTWVFEGLRSCLAWADLAPSFLSYRVPGPAVPVVVGYYASLLLAGTERRAGRVSLAVFFLFCAMVMVPPFTPGAPEAMRISALDVGNGESLLLELPRGPRLLIDGGGIARKTYFDTGEEIVSPFLWHRGLRRLDIVMASHSDYDHVGGLAAVVRNFEVSEVWIPEILAGHPSFRDLFREAASRGASIRKVRAGMVFQFGESRLEVLHPGGAAPGANSLRPNAGSIVFRVCSADPGVSALFTGDIETDIEGKLLRARGAGLHVDILKVPHHGHRSSLHPGFFRAAAARVALVSSGLGEGAEHRSPEVISALQADGTEVFSTDRDGMIEVYPEGGALRVRTYAGGDRLLREKE